jgi:hypothetical protein
MIPLDPAQKEKKQMKQIKQMKGIVRFQGICYLISLVLLPLNFFEQYRLIGGIGYFSLLIASIISLVQLMKTRKRK